jgi:ankyrin repeat protein
MSAAYSSNTSIIEFLLSRHADPSIKSDQGETAADVAHRQNHSEAETLLRKGNCTSTGSAVVNRPSRFTGITCFAQV